MALLLGVSMHGVHTTRKHHRRNDALRGDSRGSPRPTGAAIHWWHRLLRASGSDHQPSLQLAAVSPRWLRARVLAPAGRCRAATTGSLVLRSRSADVDSGYFGITQEPLRLRVSGEPPSPGVLHRNRPSLAA